MTRYRGIIFDLDGTLLDTIADIADSCNKALDKHGYPGFSEEEYKVKVGNGFKILIERCVPQRTDDKTIDSILKSFAEVYHFNYLNKTAPYLGISELLNELNEMGIMLAVNSNKRDDYIKPIISKFFSNIPFVAVYGERKGIAKKPDPTTANEIVDLMGLEKGEVLYIGDSDTDMKTAVNAGLDGVGVKWGFRTLDELKKNGAKYTVSKPEEILEIIKEA